MFRRILIANRGEVAVRIIRTLREMNIESVLVCSEADRDSLAAMMATRAVCIGPDRASESYLKQEVILETAKRLGCEAIHPGYGFLSENADFAENCRKCGLVFIGPDPEVIRLMGDKQAARSLMEASGVPVVPGSRGLVRDPEQALRAAEDIGYPVLLKASAGGGGKGIRAVTCREELPEAFRSAAAEADAAFGDASLYLEKQILSPRHIEVQLLADRSGTVAALGERDCSLQRNHQKLLEESPALFLSPELKKQMEVAAVRAAKAAGYTSAGTVEFLLDRNGRFYFIEMNTRLQVEHPVTEALTGLDLVREQIRIAAGLPLQWGGEEETRCSTGHAIECRINALGPGRVEALHFPGGPGVRVDSWIYAGCRITPFYDALLAKIIVTGKTRLEAVRRLRRALEELVVEEVQTDAAFLHLLTYHREFLKGGADTGFWERNHEEIERWMKEGAAEHEA